MTFYGVNYYLSGLHSYAQGEFVPVSKWIYVFIAVIIVILMSAYKRSRQNIIKSS